MTKGSDQRSSWKSPRIATFMAPAHLFSRVERLIDLPARSSDGIRQEAPRSYESPDGTSFIRSVTCKTAPLYSR